jgi:glutamate transport system permease protein
MTNDTAHVFDAPGPKAIRRTIMGSILAIVLVIGAVSYACTELYKKGQFDGAKWLPFIQNSDLLKFLGGGVLNTVEAAIAALLFALVLGIGLGVGRLCPNKSISVVCTLFLEFVRGAPVLLSMLFLFIAFPLAFGIQLSAFWTVVLALTLYHGAVIAEIVRAGVLTISTGQQEAAFALGLRWWQTMRLVMLPQALRVMLPSLMSQLVVLIKDSSLGFIVGYEELTERAQSAALLLNNPLQTFVVVGLVYVVINSTLSDVSEYVSKRQQRMPGQPKAAAKMPIIAAESPMTPAIQTNEED